MAVEAMCCLFVNVIHLGPSWAHQGALWVPWASYTRGPSGPPYGPHGPPRGPRGSHHWVPWASWAHQGAFSIMFHVQFAI